MIHGNKLYYPHRVLLISVAVFPCVLFLSFFGLEFVNS